MSEPNDKPVDSGPDRTEQEPADPRIPTPADADPDQAEELGGAGPAVGPGG